MSNQLSLKHFVHALVFSTTYSSFEVEKMHRGCLGSGGLEVRPVGCY